MQYVYFGLIPLAVATLLVIRGWYVYRPVSGISQFAIVVIFAVVYSYKFNIGVGLGMSALVVVVWNVWGGAIKKDREREHAKRTQVQKPFAEKSLDDFIEDLDSIGGKADKERGQKK